MNIELKTPHGKAVRRTSRRDRRCMNGFDWPKTCLSAITIGDVYVEVMIYAGHDSGYAERRPVRDAICAACAGWQTLEGRSMAFLVEKVAA